MTVWTENRLKILRNLIRQDERTLSDLTADIGFKNPKNVIGHMDALVRHKYAIIARAEPASNPCYRFNHDLSAIVILYHDRHYQSLREEIRSHPRIQTEMTRSYSSTPDEVLQVLREMTRNSNSFFEYIIENPSPDQLIQTFRFMLYPIKMIPEITEDLSFILLIQELYAMAIALDLKKNGLADNFCEPLKEIRRIFSSRYKSMMMKQRTYEGNEELETGFVTG